MTEYLTASKGPRFDPYRTHLDKVLAEIKLLQLRTA
jgi:hypothetical protein